MSSGEKTREKSFREKVDIRTIAVMLLWKCSIHRNMLSTSQPAQHGPVYEVRYSKISRNLFAGFYCIPQKNVQNEYAF